MGGIYGRQEGEQTETQVGVAGHRAGMVEPSQVLDIRPNGPTSGPIRSAEVQACSTEFLGQGPKPHQSPGAQMGVAGHGGGRVESEDQGPTECD
jgi:hypothetical protein